MAWRSRARRAAVVCVAVASVGVGLLLSWQVVRPEFIRAASTAELGILFGLFALPMIALVAWKLDCSARATAVTLETRPALTPATPEESAMRHPAADRAEAEDERATAHRRRTAVDPARG